MIHADPSIQISKPAIDIAKERGKGIVIESGLIVLGMFFESEFPKFSSDLIAALSNLNSDKFSHLIFSLSI